MKPRKFKRLPVLLRLTLCPLACCVLALVLIIQGLADFAEALWDGAKQIADFIAETFKP